MRTWLTDLDKREAIPYLLLDETGKDILNRTVPLRLQQSVQNFERRWQGRRSHDDNDDRHEAHERHSRRALHAEPVVINGHRYRLLADFQGITLGRILQRPRLIYIPILVAMLVSGVVCYLLARYLTRPILQLRRASQRMAAGPRSI